MKEVKLRKEAFNSVVQVEFEMKTKDPAKKNEKEEQTVPLSVASYRQQLLKEAIPIRLPQSHGAHTTGSFGVSAPGAKSGRDRIGYGTYGASRRQRL